MIQVLRDQEKNGATSKLSEDTLCSGQLLDDPVEQV